MKTLSLSDEELAQVRLVMAGAIAADSDKFEGQARWFDEKGHPEVGRSIRAGHAAKISIMDKLCEIGA